MLMNPMRMEMSSSWIKKMDPARQDIFKYIIGIVGIRIISSQDLIHGQANPKFESGIKDFAILKYRRLSRNYFDSRTVLKT